MVIRQPIQTNHITTDDCNSLSPSHIVHISALLSQTHSLPVIIVNTWRLVSFEAIEIACEGLIGDQGGRVSPV